MNQFQMEMKKWLKTIQENEIKALLFAKFYVIRKLRTQIDQFEQLGEELWESNQNEKYFFDIEDVVDNASIVVHFEGQENAKKTQEHEKAAKRRKIEDKTQIQVEFSFGKAEKNNMSQWQKRNVKKEIEGVVKNFVLYRNDVKKK